MKISKLFHWLYAILMLLPFAFFVPSVLYYAFNDNATMQTVEVPKTETVNVDFNQLVKNGDFVNTNEWVSIHSSLTTNNNVGTLIGTSSDSYTQQEYTPNIGHKYLACLDVKLNGTYDSDYVGLWLYGCKLPNTSQSYVQLRPDFTNVASFQKIISIVECVSSSIYSYRIYNNNTNLSIYLKNAEFFDLTQMFGSGNEPTINEFNQMFPNSYYPYTESELKQIIYDTGETEQLVQNTDIVNYAWESIWDLPLFSWSKVSFVATPFTYITGLFGLSPSNSFNYVFTYFASMSIIWLVFDVLMYIPLLTHRWLDKGIVE